MDTYHIEKARPEVSLNDTFSKAAGINQAKPSEWDAAASVVQAMTQARRIQPSDGYPVNPLSVQIGGGHYKKMALQPVEFIQINGIPFMEGNVIKYVSRWREKGGVKDLEKAKHYIEMLIAFETRKA